MKATFDRLLQSRIFLIFIFVAGLLIMLYPLISDRYYRVKQNEVVTRYHQEVETLSEEERQALIQSAREYNQGLFASGGDFFGGERMNYVENHVLENAFFNYFKEGKVIGTVSVPKVDIELPIYFGTSDEVLEKGTGLMINGSLPVGGPSTHSVITGHRGLPAARLFRDLGEVVQGDLFIVDVLGEKMAYEAEGQAIIAPTDAGLLGISPGADESTLLTCHPYMINSERLLIKGHRVPYTEETENEADRQKAKNAIKLFFVKYREYFIGLGIFLVITLGVSLWQRRRR